MKAQVVFQIIINFIGYLYSHLNVQGALQRKDKVPVMRSFRYRIQQRKGSGGGGKEDGEEEAYKRWTEAAQ